MNIASNLLPRTFVDPCPAEGNDQRLWERDWHIYDVMQTRRRHVHYLSFTARRSLIINRQRKEFLESC